MDLHTLGGLSLAGSDLSRPKPLVLLAYLAIEGPRPRRFLSELFWPGAAEPANSLRVAIRQIRRDAPGALEDDGVRLAATVRTDADRLLQGLEEGRHAAALALYRGPFLEGVDVPATGGELEEWTFATRELLADRVRLATIDLAEREAAEGEFAAAAARADAARALAGAPPPDPEMLVRMHRLALAAGARATAELAREARELGLDPPRDAAAARSELLAAAPADGPGLGRLPASLTSFVGRDPERLELARLLHDRTTRLVTLTGPGGIGKTRLALEAARAEGAGPRFRDGVAFVSLEGLTDVHSLPAAVAAAMGGEAPGDTPPAAAMVTILRGRRMLLLLDDGEGLAHGDDALAGVLAEVLAGCPDLTVLATSRGPLEVAGEQRFPLEGLPLDGAGVAARHLDAVTLFVQRGRRVRPDFELADADVPHVLAVGRAVDGSPLGIELAAAWLRFLEPAAIAAEVARSLDFLQVSTRGVPDRHTSLRAAFDHSWRLLAPEARVALARLSVFEGGFTRDAAARVADATIPLLASLHDMAMLRVAGAERWARHPLVHAFTAERLARDPDDERARREAHATYFLERAREAASRPPGAEQEAALERLDRDHDNLRAALRWTLRGGGDPAAGLALAAACYRLWYFRSHFAEGLAWLREALERTVDGPEALWPTRSEALHAAGVLSLEMGDAKAARDFLEERLRLAGDLGDDAGRSAALNSLGVAAWGEGDLVRAGRLLEESLALRRASGTCGDPDVPLVNLGLVAVARGDLATADAAFTEVLDRARANEDTMGMAIALSNLAAARVDAGRADDAARLLREAVGHYRTMGDRDGLGHCLDGFAAVASLEGRHETAARLCGAAEASRERIGSPLSASEAARHERRTAAARHALGEGGFARAAAAGRALAIEAALEEALRRVEPGARAPRGPSP